MEKYIMAIDLGTTSNRCIIFNRDAEIISKAQKEFTQYFPKPGYVEQDPNEIWSTQIGVCVEAMVKAGITANEIASIGIANQRETTIVWDKNTGEPVYNAIVWQCRRTSKYCDSLKAKGLTEFFQRKTGLIIDAYFSATKLKWILDNVEGARERAKNGDLLFGTVDSFILWKLTGGKCHYTDYSNASRTMLYNIFELKWDEEILELLDIPREMLPEVVDSAYDFGKSESRYFGGEIPINSILGDQQAALFGQCCFERGEAKNTYGTGAFLLMNIKDEHTISNNGLVTTIAWGLNNEVNYALEGSIFVAGSSIQWLRDELKILDTSDDSEYMATKVQDTNDVYFVPAFTGLGAPYWDQYARGTILGLTRGANKYHLIRATLESIAYLSNDVLTTMAEESGLQLKSLKVDGGACANNFLMQFQADILNREVLRPKTIETTAQGVAFLAGLHVGYWKSLEELKELNTLDRSFTPSMEESTRRYKIGRWKKAVAYSRNWALE